MEVKETGIEGLVEIFPRIFPDGRGYFFESYNSKKLADAGLEMTFVQDNQSFSQKGVLRGLHFQKPPYAQGKLVRVIKGRALDVAVDLRKGSKTFGQHYACELDAERHNMLYIPEGFAHGFLTLEDAVFFYKCTNYYHKPSEGGVIWNDPVLKIDWGMPDPIVSEKDRALPAFSDIKNSL